MRKSKKIVAAILCLLMIFSMMPAMALADPLETATTTIVSSEKSATPQGHLQMQKTLYYDSASNTYSIELESYATGHATVTKKAVPTDFIIVMDQSGSMDDPMREKVGNGAKDLYDNNKVSTANGKTAGYYYAVIGNRTFDLRYKDNSWQYYNDWSLDWRWKDIKSTDTNVGNIYRDVKKIEVARTALNSLINSIKEKYAAEATADKADHRLAVVGYASERNGRKIYKNNEILTGCTVTEVSGRHDGAQYKPDDAAYKNAVKTALVAADDASLSKVPGYLDAAGATQTDDGMSMADDILAAYYTKADGTLDTEALQERNRVVIVVTDGVPTSGSDFEDSVANKAISKASNCSTKYKAAVYALGIDIANDSDMSTFMNYLSSNYPEATSMSNGGKQKANTYYKHVEDGDKLDEIFKSIAETGTESNVTLDENAELVDIINPEIFVTKDVTKDQVTVYTAHYNGKALADEACFDAKQPYGEDGEDAEIDVTDGKVTVSNFDYKDNPVVEGTAGGAKLIVRIDGLKVKDNLLSATNDFTSNVGEAKIYAKAGDKDAVLGVSSPTIEGVPVDINFYYDNVKKGDETVNKFSIPGSKIIATTIYEDYAVPKTSAQPDWKMGDKIEPFGSLDSVESKSITVERKDNNAPQDIDIYLIPAVDPNEINITYIQPEGAAGTKYDTKGNKTQTHTVLTWDEVNTKVQAKGGTTAWTTPDGMKFKYWVDVETNEQYTPQDTPTFTEDTILEAFYEGTLSVTYKQPNEAGYTGSAVTVDKLAAGDYSLLSLPEVKAQAADEWTTPQGAVFDGWALESDPNKTIITSPYALTVANAANAVFVAQYTIIPQTAQVVYKQPTDLEGADGSDLRISDAVAGEYSLLTWDAVSEKAETAWTVPDGYEFDCWTEKNGSISFEAGERVTLTALTTRTFVAKYKPIPAATVTYTQPDGAAGSDVVCAKLPVGNYDLAAWNNICGKAAADEALNDWAAPEGKQFKEWKNVDTHETYQEGEQIALKDKDNLTFEAVYEDIPATKVTVTYKQPNGVDGTDLVLENVEVNSAYDVLPWDEVAEEVAAKDGSTAWTVPDNKRFAGWKLDGTEDSQKLGSTYDLQRDTTFVAVYEEVPVEKFTLRVRYHQHEGYAGEVVEADDITVKDGAELTLLNLDAVKAKVPAEGTAWNEPANVEFTGWSLENSTTLLLGGSKYEVNKDILTEVGDNVYHLDLWANYSEKEAEKVKVTYKQPDNAVGSAYEFELPKGTGTEVLSWDAVAEQVKANGTAWEMPDGAYFRGWSCESGNYSAGKTVDNLQSDITFVAEYAQPIVRVIYKQAVGTDYSGSDVEYILDKLPNDRQITLNSHADVVAKAEEKNAEDADFALWKTLSSKRFNGWQKEEAANGIYQAGETYTITDEELDPEIVTIVFRATYKDKGSTTVFYTLDFVTNGGNEIASITRAGGTIVDLDEYVPTRKGYNFQGWYTDEKLTNKVTSVTLTENMKVYAKWSAKTVDEDGTPSDLNSKDHIKYVVGYPDGYVRPNNFVTRAETASMLYRLLTDERRNEVRTTTNNFVDVTPNAWYNEPASSMYKGGYIAGYKDGTFGGNKNITRAEFVSMLVRFLGEDQGSMSFTDVPQNHWAAKDIAIAASQSWVAGYSDGTFKPNQPITRAEAMSIINRVLNRGVNEKSNIMGFKIWSDNYSNAWYYYDVIEATNAHDYTGSRPSENWSNVR